MTEYEVRFAVPEQYRLDAQEIEDMLAAWLDDEVVIIEFGEV